MTITLAQNDIAKHLLSSLKKDLKTQKHSAYEVEPGGTRNFLVQLSKAPKEGSKTKVKVEELSDRKTELLKVEDPAALLRGWGGPSDLEKIDPNFKDPFTFINHYAETGNLPALQLAYGLGFDLTEDKSAVDLAALNGRHRVLEYFADKGFDFTSIVGGDSSDPLCSGLDPNEDAATIKLLNEIIERQTAAQESRSRRSSS